MICKQYQTNQQKSAFSFLQEITSKYDPKTSNNSYHINRIQIK